MSEPLGYLWHLSEDDIQRLRATQVTGMDLMKLFIDALRNAGYQGKLTLSQDAAHLFGIDIRYQPHPDDPTGPPQLPWGKSA